LVFETNVTVKCGNNFSKLLHDATIQHVAVCTPDTVCAAEFSCDRTMLRHACNIRAITTAGEYVLPYHGLSQARQCAPKIAAVCARQVYTYGTFMNVGRPVCRHHPTNIERDSKRGTQFCTSIFPELYIIYK